LKRRGYCRPALHLEKQPLAEPQGTQRKPDGGKIVIPEIAAMGEIIRNPREVTWVHGSVEDAESRVPGTA
jgi:hypothetical protein